MGMNTLSINGTTIPDLYIDTAESFNKPKKNVETINVPGRNGDLVIDYGTFQNVLITYPCYIRGSFDSKFQTLMNLLGTMTGYQRIECSNDATHYRLGIPVLPQTPTVKRVNKDGYFDLVFNCKPQRFLKSGETQITISGATTLTNPTGYEAWPTIIVENPGTFTSGTLISLDMPSAMRETITTTVDTLYPFYVNPVYIDCRLMECYELWPDGDKQNANPVISFSPNNFPRLYGADRGNKTVITPGTLASFKIVPNWWEL